MSTFSEQLQLKFMEGFEQAQSNRETRHILLNALEVFARKGLDGTKIKDIAQQAGFSQGYVYHYFKSKDDIFTRLVELAADGAGDSVRYASQLDGTPYEKLHGLTEALLAPNSIAMQHWRLILIQAAASDAIPEEARRIAREKASKPIEHLIPIIAEGQRLGQFVAESPLVLAVTYFSVVQGLALTRIQNGPDIPFPTTELILRFIRLDV